MARRDGLVVVTGAAHGIGRAAAERFVADGRVTVGVDRVREDAPYPIEVVDLANLDATSTLIESLEATWGPISALVNVAGIYERIDPASFSLEAYRRVLAVDLDAPIVLSAAAATKMAQRGFGRIVNVTSIHGEFGERGGLAYDVAKGGSTRPPARSRWSSPTAAFCATGSLPDSSIPRWQWSTACSSPRRMSSAERTLREDACHSAAPPRPAISRVSSPGSPPPTTRT